MHAISYGFRPTLCALTLSITTVPLQAQFPRFSVGPGASIPLGNYGVVDNAGWHLLAVAVVRSPFASLPFRLDGLYSVTTHQGSEVDPV